MRVDVFCTVDRLFMADPRWPPLAGGVAQRRRGRRDEQRLWPEDSSSQGGKHDVLQDGRQQGRACRPAARVKWHTAELIFETFVLVQVLDAPVPRMGN